MKQFIPQKICLKCLGCCRFANSRSKWSPCLLSREIKIFKKKHIPLFLRPKSKKLRLVSGNDQFFCPFFNVVKNSCGIYGVRPFDCQLYPFMLRKRKNKVYIAVDINCPYIEKTFRGKKFNRYLNNLIIFLSQPSIKNIIRRDSQIIGNFPEKTVINLACLPLNK